MTIEANKLYKFENGELADADKVLTNTSFLLNQVMIISNDSNRVSNDNDGYLNISLKNETDFSLSTCMKKRDIAFCKEIDFVDNATLNTDIWSSSTSGTGVVDVQGVDAETYYIRVYASESH